jgi:hypothetical protein
LQRSILTIPASAVRNTYSNLLVVQVAKLFSTFNLNIEIEQHEVLVTPEEETLLYGNKAAIERQC